MGTLPYDALALTHAAGSRHGSWFAANIPGILRLQQPDGSFISHPGKDSPLRKETAIRNCASVCLALETPWRYHLEP